MRLRALAPWLVAVAAIALVLLARAALVEAPARVGSLHLPRGGPYVLGFTSPGPATLEVAGRRLAGRGLVKERILLEAGVVPLRFDAPPGARLIWSPPGRRGDPEYVPASSLAPAGAGFDHPGTARGDALAALAIVVIVAGLALWLARARLARVPREVWLGGAAVLALALLVRVWDLGGQGQTWDEDTYYAAGKNYLQNLLRGDLDDAAWRWNFEHPPVSKYLAGLGGLWTDGYAGARLVSAIVMALACALLVPIGARLHRLSTGVAAGLVAALTPHLIAHGQIVGHEAPTALVAVLALWASLRVWDAGEAARALVPRLALCGVVLGVAISVRFVNVLLAAPIGLTVLVTAPSARAARRAVGWGLAVMPAVALLTMIALWPRLWTHPVAHLDEAWHKLKGTHSKEPFLGVLTESPPRWYFLVYLYATAPLGLLVAALGGAVAWGRAPERRRGLLIAALWLAAPLAVALSPVRQDGVRYVIPCLLLLALLAGAGASAAAELVRARLGRAWPAPIAVLALYLAVVCARIHPFYLDYYGEQVGGPAGAARGKRFELAWWGEGLEPAIAYVNRHAAPGDRVHRSCVEPIHLTWFRGDLWEPVPDPRAARWIVHYQPSWRPCPLPPGATRVFTVAAQGAPLAHVYRNDAAGASP